MTAAAHTAPRSRVAFVINSLATGGAERVMMSVLARTPRAHWDSHLILLDRESDYRTPPDFVQIHRLDYEYGLLSSVRQLRRKLAVLKPDLVVSFLVRANVATVLAARSLKIPCVISERSQLSTHLEKEHAGMKRLAATAAPRLAYPLADHIISVSEGVRSDLVCNFGVWPERVATIYNPYDIEQIERDARAEPEFALPNRFIVSAGRLVKRKGFDDLLDAYAAAGLELPLCILGEGGEHGRLAARIDALGLKGRVHLLGYAVNPFAIVGRARMFVSPSHCEGFPNAIAEAMAVGVPVVSTDCPSGPAELLDEVESVGVAGLHEGRYGLLVPVGRPDLLAEAMRKMNEPDTRERYSAAARQRLGDFRVAAITDQYWATFGRVLADRRDARARQRLRQPPGRASAFLADREHAEP